VKVVEARSTIQTTDRPAYAFGHLVNRDREVEVSFYVTFADREDATAFEQAVRDLLEKP
jgi:hypothetical protein